MNICSNCKVEMTCIKTGRVVRYNGTHAYSGDEFKCNKCGSKIVICNKNPYHNEILERHDIYMDGDYVDYAPKENINLRKTQNGSVLQ